MNTDRDLSLSSSAPVARSDCTLSSGYQPRFESRWGPWGFSGNISPHNPSPSPQNRCRSPVKVDSSTLNTDEDVEDEDDDRENDEDEAEQEDGKGLKEPTTAAGDLELASRVGVGLRNLGNTCFVNAVLQCLVHTYPLEQGLSMVQDNLLCFLDSFCLICFLKRLIHCSFTLSDEISPIRIVTNLKYFSPEFSRFQQEDAHEFLQCLLNKLEQYQIRSNPFSVTRSDNLLKQVFGGSLVSRLRCSKCNHVSSTPEDLIDLSLEIDEVNTLKGALDSFTKPEKIEDISLTCKSCNEIASVEKQFMVEKAPTVASFHLKRFKSDGTTVEKIRKHIDYPLTLNLHPYTVDHPKHSGGLIYDLYAVIVHFGYSSNGGHYYSFVRSSPSVWHEFDDSSVTRVSESHVLSQEAYILFYSKREASWFFNGNGVRSPCPPIISPNSVLDNLNQSGESSSESSRKCDDQVSGQDEGNVATCEPTILTCKEQLDYNQAQICSTSITTSAVTCAISTVREASNWTSDKPISADLCPTKFANSMAPSSSSREDTKVEKRFLRKRSAYKAFDDQRTRRISKVDRRNNNKGHKFRGRSNGRKGWYPNKKRKRGR